MKWQKLESQNSRWRLVAQTYPKEAMKNTMAPVTIKMIGGAWNRPSKKWLNSFMSARTSAPAIKIPSPDNCAIKVKSLITAENFRRWFEIQFFQVLFISSAESSWKMGQWHSQN